MSGTANTIATIAAGTAPAGGAEMGQVIGMTVVLSIAFGALAWLGEAHRHGRRTPLGTLAAFSERVSGLPSWAAIPLAVAGISLIGAFFGYMWDVSWHIDRGRDPGPLANPAHYFILAGLYGVIAAGYLSTVLPKEGKQPGRSALRIADGWEVPLGGALIGASGIFAFIGFPLDDLWHRMFGQDVTLWGPTHLMMLGGGLLTLIGVAILFEEGVANSPRRYGPPRPRPTPAAPGREAEEAAVDKRPVRKSRKLLVRVADLLPNVPLTPSRMLIAGGFLTGLSIFQGEFDFGVPQFELVLQPLLISVSAAISLVAARLWIGRGGALGAVAFYLVIRGAISLLVGPILGEVTPSLPLYVPEAICVELVALLVLRDGADRRLAGRPRTPVPQRVRSGAGGLVLGALAGLAIGTLGFAGEWPWIDAVMPIEWTRALLPEGPLVAAFGGLAGGLIGAVFGLGLKRELPRPRLAGGVAVASLTAIMACFAFGLADHTPSGASSRVTLTEVAPAPKREVLATVRFTPPTIADGASWVRGISWQGGDLVGFPLEKIGEGVYRTPEPLPVYGDWKAGIRIQNGHSVIGTAIYAPADAAIPVAEVPASTNFTRPLRPDRELLQRERKRDVAPWLWTAASLVVLFLFFGFFTLIAVALNRYSRGALDPTPPIRSTRLAPHPRQPRTRSGGAVG
ncbi:MAG: hypothetical protein QOD60_1093 [Solirubrobacterales bacterium]|nr:hypothetical protein [Solirubrobacterales bacterium]